jgi:transcriptional regulator with XRE-family HTH domain/tetratricopeptide (TPR) repeat protein
MNTVRVTTFADLLRRYRRATGLTQEELAERAGLSVRAVSDLERGLRRNPHQDTVQLLADALGLGEAERAALAATARRSRSGTATALLVSVASAPVLRSGSMGLPLVGRIAELAHIEMLLSGDGPPVLLAGEPGIGKSRLLDEAAGRGSTRGWQVVAGGCTMRSGQGPFEPLLGALARSLSQRSAAHRRLDLEGCAWLVRLLPELAETALVPAPAWTLPPEQERRLVSAAVGRYLANVAGPAGTLLVLDDLQWAEADALDLLSTVVRAAEHPLRVVGAYRSTEMRPQDSLGLWLAELGPLGLASHLALGPLPGQDAGELLDLLLTQGQGGQAKVPRPDGHPPDAPAAAIALRERVLERAEGVPFFLVSCVQGLRSGALPSEPVDPSTRAPRRRGDAVPWDVAQSIRRRVAALPDLAQTLVGIAAVAGRVVARADLVAALPAGGEFADGEATLAALDALTQAGLVVETGAEAYAFAHDLIRDVILSDLSAARREVWHRRVGEALERLAEPARQRRAAELAWHYAEGAAPARALPYTFEAAYQARRTYAYAEAEQHYRRALELARELGEQPREAEALEHLGEVCSYQGRYAESLAALDAATVIQRALGDLDRVARDTAGMTRTYCLLDQPSDGLARLQALLEALATPAETEPSVTAPHALQPALPSPPQGPTRSLEAYAARAAVQLSARTACRVYLSLTVYLVFLERYEEAIPLGERAVQYAQHAGEQGRQARAQAFFGIALLAVGRVRDAQAAFEAGLVVAEAAGDLEGLGLTSGNLAFVYEQRGQLDDARRCMARALEAAEGEGVQDNVVQILCGLAEGAYKAGQWDQARAYCACAAVIDRSLIARSTSNTVMLMQGILRLAEGQLQREHADLEAAIALAEQAVDPHIVRMAELAMAEHDLLLGHAAHAQQRVTHVLNQQGRHVYDELALLPLLAWAYAELGEPAQAAAVLADCLARAAALEVRLVQVDALRIQAVLALRQGVPAEAEQALVRSLAAAHSLPYPYAEAKAFYVYGQLHAAGGESKRARERYEAAISICERLGEALYRPHIERALAALRHEQTV